MLLLFFCGIAHKYTLFKGPKSQVNIFLTLKYGRMRPNGQFCAFQCFSKNNRITDQCKYYESTFYLIFFFFGMIIIGRDRNFNLFSFPHLFFKKATFTRVFPNFLENIWFNVGT